MKLPKNFTRYLLLAAAILVVCAIVIVICIVGNKPSDDTPNIDTPPTHQHTVVTDAAVAATCTSTGLSEGSHCSECGEVIAAQTIIDKVGHTEVIDAAKAPTCAETGLTEGKHCSVCNEVLVAQQPLPATGHIYDNDQDSSCNVCGYIRNVACVHTNTTKLSERNATCTQNGLTEGKTCTDCGEILVSQQTIPAIGHTEIIDVAKAPTCTVNGITEGKHCSVCNTILVTQQTVLSTGHVYDDKYDETCNVCGHTRDAECAHTNVTTLSGFDATCTQDGLTEGKQCSKCGEIIVAQQTILATGHTEVIDKAKNPTCTSTGLTEGKHCSSCQIVFIAQAVVPMKDHTEGAWIIDKEATATETGKKHQICAVCGETINEVILPKIVEFEYTVSADNLSCTITGIRSISDTNLYIPEYIDGYKVTGIGQKAFAEQTELTAIIIPNTVTTIGTRAFYGCTGLTEIAIPASVTSIGTQIFYKASNLSTVYYNSTYQHSDNPFLNLAHITKIVFGGKSIPSYILDGNTCVKEVVIADGVKSISNYAFRGCSSLTSIVIPDSVTSINYAFRGCWSLTSIVIGNSVTSIGDDAFEGCSSLTSIVIGNSVTSIGKRAFEGCSSLTSIVIGNSVTSIGRRAFYDCSSLTSIEIPDSVTSIGDGAFYDCSSLTSVYITDIEAWLNIDFVDCNSNPCYYGADLYLNNEKLTEVIIPDSVTSIGDEAFHGCSSLTSIVIPDSVTSIGNGAFYDCSSLTSIVIPDSVTSIGSFAFYECSSLTSIVIPDSVTSIGDEAFHGCSSLTSIEIPDSVTSIGDQAFCGCSSLTSIVIPDSVTSIGYYAFSGCSSLESITVEQGNTVYHSAGNCLIETASKTLIAGCKNSVIPTDGSVTSIGELAFGGCSSLTSIVIPDSVTSIDWGAFNGCSSLTSIEFGGTKAQWNAISKVYNWDYNTGNYTVHCTDGDITK